MQKIQYCMRRHDTLNEFYNVLCMLSGICVERGLQCIIENPYSQPHYLNQLWCFDPAIIDKDRRERGDSMKKPTQFFWINREPEHNFIFEPITYKEQRKVCEIHGKERSEIEPEYANRFIREFILKGDSPGELQLF